MRTTPFSWAGRPQHLTLALSAGLGAAAIVAAALLVTGPGLAGLRAAPDEPWPPFVMVYRDTAKGYGLNGAVGTQVFRVEYSNRRNFRSVLLEHSAVPEAVGLTQTFDGRQSTFADPRFGVRTTSYAPDQATVPADWLVPSRVPPLAHRPGAQVMPLGNGLGLVRHEAVYNGRTIRVELTYREADGIPTSVLHTANGEETRRVEVVELRLGSR